MRSSRSDGAGNMRKACFLLILIICGIWVTGFEKVNDPPLIEWLPEYNHAKCYCGKGFQDYAQYCEYRYEKDVIKFIDKEQALMCVTSDDEIRVIAEYFENFRKWIENEKFKDKCNFDLADVTVGDYYWIENYYKDEDFDYNPNKYPTYGVYWFDKETLTMRFVRNVV